LSTLDGWKLNVGMLVARLIPGHDLDGAKSLAEAWLTDNGGWIPNDVGDPTGEGMSSGGETDEEAADAISSEQIGRTKHLTMTVPLTVRAAVSGSFATGTTTADMRDALKSFIESRIESLFTSDGSVPVSFTWTSSTTSVRSTGNMNAAARVDVEAEIAAGENLSDCASVAVSAARGHYGLTNLWNASFVYTKDNDPSSQVYVEVRKYGSTSYDSLDNAVSYFHVVGLDKTSGQVQTLTRIDQ